jgi:hypothetical protein
VPTSLLVRFASYSSVYTDPEAEVEEEEPKTLTICFSHIHEDEAYLALFDLVSDMGMLSLFCITILFFRQRRVFGSFCRENRCRARCYREKEN